MEFPTARVLHILISAVLIHSFARASEVMPPRLYEITIETGMPHLEENLRYAITRERRCLVQQELSSAFPILSHPALKGCKLDRESRQGDSVSYVLVCEDEYGATGRATWQDRRNLISGTLDFKLGGKNMTFYQRVTARALASCPTVSERR